MKSRALLILAVILAACDGTKVQVTDDYVPLPADQVWTGFDHIVTENGVRRSNLLADTAYIFEDSAKTHLIGVTLQMYDNEGHPTTRLTSDAGEYNNGTQKVVARGNVVLERPGPEGYTIWTEELHYDPLSKRVWSDVETRMLTKDGQDLHGQGFTTDDQFTNINIRGGAGTGLELPVRER